MSSTIYYIMILTYHMLETRSDSPRDMLIDWRDPNIFMTNLMRNAKNSRRLKRRLSQDMPDPIIIL